MEITSYATPALLFPAITLLMLSYTSKFLAIAALIRNLNDRYQKEQQAILVDQIANLRRRLLLIRSMQSYAIASFLLCFVCMVFLFLEYKEAATFSFALSLALMIFSLVLSLQEIRLSSGALELLLKGFEKKKEK